LFVFENFNFSVQVFKFHAGHYLIWLIWVSLFGQLNSANTEPRIGD
jgi:hypothetical protein